MARLVFDEKTKTNIDSVIAVTEESNYKHKVHIYQNENGTVIAESQESEALEKIAKKVKGGKLLNN